MKFKIAYLYPEHLNLYGDTGNVEILKSRASQRNIGAEVIEVTSDSKISEDFFKDISVVVMGGGPDSSQKEMSDDFLYSKGIYLKEYMESGGFGVFVCGSFQLLGKYYKSADGTEIEGLGILPFYTEHFGDSKPRCIGNVTAKLNKDLSDDEFFQNYLDFENKIVGFENHGGRTYLENNEHAFAKIEKGFGNNGEDSTEGIHYKNFIGTYLHGPIFSKNPHLADYIIAKSLKLDKLELLDDSLVFKAFTASKKLKQ